MKKLILHLLILSLAVAAHAGDGPGIQFKDIIFDFGTVTCGEIVSHDFAFVNTGDQTLVITDVHPGCGCTTATNWTQRVAPGRTGVIPIRFDSSHFSGPVSKAIMVGSNARSKELLCLILKGKVFRAFTVDPMTAVLVLRPEQTSATARVKITYNGTDPISILDPAVSSAAGNSYDVALATNSPGSEFTLSVSARVFIQSGVDYGNITLRTTATNGRSLTVPLVVSRSPWLSVYPSPLILSKNATNEANALITVINNASSPVTVSNPKASDRKLAVELASTKPGFAYTLRVTVPAGYAEGAPARIVAETSNTNQPSLVIPIEQR